MTTEIRTKKMTNHVDEKKQRALRSTSAFSFDSSWEMILFAGILVLAIVTRFANLGERAMSHDESLHTYYSYTFAEGDGYAHNPMTHGPLQFHLLNATYQLLGVTDFTARIPAALCGVLAIGLVWLLRRDLGKVGSFVAMGLLLISPYMLFYSRYVRNEALLMPIAILTLWAILRFYQTENKQYLIGLSVISALNFTLKETAFFYTAQVMVFAGLVFLVRTERRKWRSERDRKYYYVLLMMAVLAAMGAILVSVLTGTEGGFNPIALLVGAVVMVGMAVGAVHMLRKDMGQEEFAANPSMGLMINLGTIVLPMLSPLVVSALGRNALAYEDPQSLRMTGIVVGVLFVLSFLIGFWWDLKQWVLNQVAFYSIFTLFYTTLFSNPDGFFTGLVGSLGYWLEQQGVARGSQPWYYYLLVQLPVYEYLPLLGSLMGIGILVGLILRTKKTAAWQKNQFLFPLLMAFWSVTSVVMFSYAGEKMPWLTVHMTMPMILLTAWVIRFWVLRMDWEGFATIEWRGLGIVLMGVWLLSGILLIGQLLGTNVPFAGMTQVALENTYQFLLKLMVFGASGYFAVKIFGEWERKSLVSMVLIVFVGLLSLTTLRTSLTATFVNDEHGNEYLVYAHAGTGVKHVMDEIEWISTQTMDGTSLPISFDGEASWPITWYLRDYRNAQVFYVPEVEDEEGNLVKEMPTFTNPIVILDDLHFAIETTQLQEDYVAMETLRMVWPNQDYFKGVIGTMFFERLRDPAYREAFFQIWWDRDFSRYSQLNGYAITESNWTPGDRMRLYVEKDFAAKIWNFNWQEEATASE